jgi:hypothetical protein
MHSLPRTRSLRKTTDDLRSPLRTHEPPLAKCSIRGGRYHVKTCFASLATVARVAAAAIGGRGGTSAVW